MIKGPKISPKIPNKNNPPIIPIRINGGGRLVLFETIIGLKKLSIREEAVPKIIIPTAAKLFPVTNR